MHAALEQTVAAAGYDLEDVSVQLMGRRRQVRVVIDRDDGVDLDAAADLSRTLSELLDELDGSGDGPDDAAYVLEVTSPGIGRPLTLPRHFRRAARRLVRITTASGGHLDGRVHSADPDPSGAVHLLTGKRGLDPLSLPYAQVQQAVVEVEFNPPPAPVVQALDSPFTAPIGDSEAGSMPAPTPFPTGPTDAAAPAAIRSAGPGGHVHQEVDPR